jgi:cobalt-zinc-cadmium efflux system protein
MPEHNHGNGDNGGGEKSLRISLIIVIFFMAVEIAGGIFSNSLALLGDAGHMFVDALALTLSLVALTLSRRPATPTRTFGYYRAEIIAALANGVLLVGIAVYILIEAYERFTNPPVVKAPLMLVVSIIGLLANLVMVLLLRRNHGSLNIRAAFWHVATDTLSSVGVIIAGVIIQLTGQGIADPIIAAIISLIIFVGAVRLVGESVEILLEAVPSRIDIKAVVNAIKTIPGVEDVHDIHIWTITSGVFALSTHLAIQDRAVSVSGRLMAQVNEKLEHEFGIRHTTLQLECDTCVCETTPGACPLQARKGKELNGVSTKP